MHEILDRGKIYPPFIDYGPVINFTDINGSFYLHNNSVSSSYCDLIDKESTQRQ